MYLEHIEFPGDDAGYADAAGHPVRHAECAGCARRYGRGHLLDEDPSAPMNTTDILDQTTGSRRLCEVVAAARLIDPRIEGTRHD
ncbi:hypothetical protein [Prescottella subtropica]|uniref:hypothetical protein n=1 Tax=Prescottella subtropica TaxID=2545757 RepID=UPI0010F8110B|nr:hypothetical protein [Prescottella subtropica]